MKRGEISALADGRDVLIVSLTGLEDAYGAVLAIVLHPSGRYPDTAMSVVLGDPIPATAVAVNLQQLRTTRFDGGPTAAQSPPRPWPASTRRCAPSLTCSHLTAWADSHDHQEAAHRQTADRPLTPGVARWPRPVVARKGIGLRGTSALRRRNGPHDNRFGAAVEAGSVHAADRDPAH